MKTTDLNVTSEIVYNFETYSLNKIALNAVRLWIASQNELSFCSKDIILDSTLYRIYQP